MNGSSRTTRRVASTIVTFMLLSALAIVAVPVTAGASAKASKPAATSAVAPNLKAAKGTNYLWHVVSKNGVVPSAFASNSPLAIHATHVGMYTLNATAMRKVLATAPMEFTNAARTNPLVISLPTPDGTFQRFAVAYSPVMMPGLAKKHPDMRTYAGTGIDDPTATMRLAMTPLGLSSMVRGHGTWLTGTYYHLNQSLYGSYYSHDVINNEGTFQEKEDATLEKQGEAQAAAMAASGVSPLVAVGSTLKIYRLALVTDPGYANYWGFDPNNAVVTNNLVTAAKVELMNRINMAYENDFSYRLDLVANNDLLNLNTYAQAIGRNGPCGNAACFSLANISSCSSLTVIGPAIARILPGGANSYDIGHLGLGAPGGGVSGLGVVGGGSKYQSCTGIPEPDGDYYAIDYVAHEMGHEFGMNHPFNGNLDNCSGGNRNNPTAVEPGSGSSIMAYAGICQQDDLQPHSDPYFSQRSFDETQAYTSSTLNPVNEVQQGAFLHLGGGNEVQQVTFGPGYAPSWTIRAGSLNVVALSSTVAGVSEVGNTVTVNTTAAHTMQPGDTFTISGVANSAYNCAGCTVTSVGAYSGSFNYTDPTSGLAPSGSGTVVLASPGLTEVGTTATVQTTTPLTNLNVGDLVTITGAGVSGYNCAAATPCAVTAIPTANTFTYTTVASGLANSGAGTVTKNSAFQIQIGGNDSAVIGGPGLIYNNANLTSAINAISGFAGTVTVSGAASTGFTVTYGGASAGIDVPNFSFDNLSCGGCFAQVAETNHGGAFDSFTLNYGGTDSAVITNGTNYTTTGVQAALQGTNEVQTVSLTGYTVNGNSYTLNYGGPDSVPITRGQNNTTAGIAAAIAGGNEQQAMTTTGFVSGTSSYQIQYAGNNSVTLGTGGLAINTADIQTAIAGISGFPVGGTVTASGVSGTTGNFTATFGGTLANTDVSSLSIVNCLPACSGVVRENVKGTSGVLGAPAGSTVTIGSLADTGYTITYNGLGNVTQPTVTNGTGGVTGTVATGTSGTSGILPNGASVTIGSLSNTGFTVTYGGVLSGTQPGGANVSLLTVTNPSAGLSGWFGVTAKGGPAPYNQGFIQQPTGNTPPTVTTAASETIPYQTPFALTGSATDPDMGQTLTYMWEQNDAGTGTILTNNVKTTGPLFRQFGTALDGTQYDLHANITTYCANGENCTTTNPTRVFPDLQQILINNTNAVTGSCPQGTTYDMPLPLIDCYSEFLPTSGYTGPMHFRLTVRDGAMGAGGVNSANTTVNLAPGTGPFLVTSQSGPTSYQGLSNQTVTWNVAGTNAAPISTSQVNILLSTDGGNTFPTTLAAAVPNNGSANVTIPAMATTQARIEVQPVGNVYFDINDNNFTITQAPQTITFGPLANTTWGDPDFNVSATASSGLTVSFTAAGTCTVTGTLVHATSGGFCTITAHQPGDVNYLAAPDVSQSFTINQAPQTITFGPLANKTFTDPDFNVSATASSGLTVSFTAAGNCTVAGTLVHITGAGSCTITAHQPGDVDYLAAPDVSQSFNIAKHSQSITFPAITRRTFGSPDFNPGATASSGLIVTYTASGGVCSILGGMVHMVGTTPGTCTVTAHQNGDANWLIAVPVSRHFTVAAVNTATHLTGTTPVAPNATITLNATVTSPAGNPVSGVVKFYALAGNTLLDTVNVNNGHASTQVTAPGSAGNIKFYAKYVGVPGSGWHSSQSTNITVHVT